MRNEQIAAYLYANCRGRTQAVRSAELEQALGVSGNELRRRINRLRRRGIPIGSSRDGYFYAVTAGEVFATIRQLMEMERGLDAAIQGLVTSLDRFGEEAEASGDRG